MIMRSSGPLVVAEGATLARGPWPRRRRAETVWYGPLMADVGCHHAEPCRSDSRQLRAPGIVLWETSAPDESWLKIQKDSRIRSVGACQWWTVAPLIGGGVCVPEPLAEYVRPATVDDALQVAREHKMSYFTLVKVFPRLAELMLPPALE